MEKEVFINEKKIEPCSLVSKKDLEEAGFVQESQIEGNQKYICLSNGSKKLILEVLMDDNFKVFDIK